MWKSFLDRLPRGYTLEEEDWQRRHRLLLKVLAVHVPGLALFGIVLGRDPAVIASLLLTPLACVGMGVLLREHRRTASVIVTGGLVYSSAALVGITGGAIEAHFHFFIIIGFIALYQDWAPFLFNIVFTVISHGVGSAWQETLIFAHAEGQTSPWLWSLIHGVAVLFACVGMMLFWRITEEQQQQKNALAHRLAEVEVGRRQFTSDLLVNLARRNQSMLYRQLDIINQLEESERDPDALAELFKLDHLATRVRRNAESLLVLSGEQPPRIWSEPVPLRDVVRAAIAETEELERVVFIVEERPAVAGHAVTDLTHLLAELTENAVRFSPPETVVTIRARPDREDLGGQLITVEDWGIGLPPHELAAANALLAHPPEVDLSVAQRLGLHVIARLAARHDVRVSLTATPGSGITALAALPSRLFEVRTSEPGPARRDRVVRGGSSARTAPAPAPVPTATIGTLTCGALPEVGTPALVTPGTSVPAPRTETPAGSPFGSDGAWSGWWQAPEEIAVAPGSPGTDRPADGHPPDGNPANGRLPDCHPDRTTTGEDRSAPGHPEHPAAGAGVQVPRPRPAPPVTGPPPAPAVDPATGLRRRVPQSHLAPELRVAARPDPEQPSLPPAHAAEAASALSRYQASRRTADDAAGDAGAPGWRS